MLKEKIQKQKIIWEKVATKGKNMELLLIDILGRAYMRFAKRRNKSVFQFSPNYYRQFDGARWFSLKEINFFIKKVKEAEKRKPGSILEYFKRYISIMKEVRSRATKLSKEKVKNISNKQLVNFINRFVEVNTKFTCYSYNYIIYNRFLPNELMDIIIKKEKSPDLQNKYFETLTALVEPSETRLEKEAILKIVKQVEEEKIGQQKLDTLIKNHLKKYAYFGFYYFRGKPWTNLVIKKRIKDWKKKDYNKELQLLKEQGNNFKETYKIFKKLRFSQKEKILALTLKEMALAAQTFDEVYNYLTFCTHHFWKEIAKRMGVSYQELIQVDIDEMKIHLGKGIKVSAKFKNELKLREKDHAIIFEKGKMRILTGKALKQYYFKEKRIEETLGDIKQLNGQSASSGKAKGAVKIILNIKEISKVKKGDILVAPQTVPSYVTAMEKSAAIVTDEGGLLCHAAIVSRELGIPCVIGTKIATAVLHDGDLVEVDANRGIVRRVSKD